jgi:hypothetical protein
MKAKLPKNLKSHAKPTTEDTEEQLISVLNDLEHEVEKQNSWKLVFLRGTIHGLGTVIGATVLIAIIASVLAVVFNLLGISDVPFIGSLTENQTPR